MAEVVLDSSAVLALLGLESGRDQVSTVVDRALISVVNEAEVISVLIRRGESQAQATAIVGHLPYQAVALDRGLARRAGALWREFKPRGLSLGDRCCLALAEREGLPVLTGDRRWKEVALGVEVRLLR